MHFLVFCSGLKQSEAESCYINIARTLDFYGVELHGGRVCILVVSWFRNYFCCESLIASLMKEFLICYDKQDLFKAVQKVYQY